MNDPPRLIDLGERRIIHELLRARYAGVANFGDDAATVGASSSGGTIVATTDPCPPPMAEALGARDPFYAGWLLATLNLSDVAAAGAVPLGLVTSLVLPTETTVADFARLLDGIDECCATVGTGVVGGNLKEGPKRDLTATAIGLCEGRAPLTRSGGRPGDHVVVLGDLGDFWAGALGVRRGLFSIDSAEPLLRNVLMPEPKTKLMIDLAERGLVSASIDNSDGLYPTLLQLAGASRGAIIVRSEQFRIGERAREVAAQLGIEPVRLTLGWGDWHVIVACRPDHTDQLLSRAATHGIAASPIGGIEPGEGVFLEHEGRTGPLMPLDSQRFTAASWFTSGLDGYVRTLVEAPLFGDLRPGVMSPSEPVV